MLFERELKLFEKVLLLGKYFDGIVHRMQITSATLLKTYIIIGCSFN